MIVLGITGSIAMGKSTAGSMLESEGIPVHDADSCVHDLLTFGSPAWQAFTAAFPYFSYPQVYSKKFSWKLWRYKKQPWIRGINRAALGKLVFNDDELREKLESVLHPFVRESQQEFIRAQQRLGSKIVALDIPLLFETGADKNLDYTVTISAPYALQRERVLARPNMSEEKFEKILKRQMPDGEKCARSDFVIHSGLGRAHMMKELKLMLKQINIDTK